MISSFKHILVNAIVRASYVSILVSFFVFYSTDAFANIVIERSGYKSYVAFLKGRDPLTITEFSGSNTPRSVIELILLQQALHLGGYDKPLKFEFAPNYARILRHVAQGTYALSGNTAWKHDLENDAKSYYISQEIIKSGMFEAGLYTTFDKANQLTEEDLPNLTAVSSRFWIADWRALSQLPLKALYDVPSWSSMLDMVLSNRIDFLLQPFNGSEDLTVVTKGTRLAPIKNIKLILVGTRHFYVSKNHPEGEAIYKALEKGLTQLKQQNRIEKAFKQSGFINEKVADWKTLNPQ